MFDSSKTGKIEKEKVRTILNTLGHTYDDQELEALLIQEDKEGEFLKTYGMPCNPKKPQNYIQFLSFRLDTLENL